MIFLHTSRFSIPSVSQSREIIYEVCNVHLINSVFENFDKRASDFFYLIFNSLNYV